MERPLESWSRQELARRRAVLLQSSRLSFAFSVSEVVLMGRIPHNHDTESAKDYHIAEQALAYVGMSRFADRIYHTLSGGEQQRVHLARVLAQIWEPPAEGERYLLLDEPTSSLDLLYQQQVLNVARQFARVGTAVLVILHDLNLAAQYADRILMLKAGQACYTGAPQQVLTSHHIQDVYDTPVAVIPHPHSSTPLITPLPLETAVAGEIGPI
jgi:iron complex transport system ATP-binding protein